MTISLTFPDGAQREFPSGLTGVEIAKGISPSLLKRTVAMALDGTVVDLADPIDRDARIEFLNREVTFGAPATQWWVQLSTAMLFGLTFATILTLIVTPASLQMVANISEWRKRRKTARLKHQPAAG